MINILTTAPRAREGFALPVALLAMIVIGAIVTGGFYVSAQEHEISLSTDLGAQALYAAEYGIGERVGTWVNADMEQLATGAEYQYPVMNGGRQIGSYVIRVLPIGENGYMIQSEGEVSRGTRTARRRVATFVRTMTASMPYEGAMTVIGGLAASGNSLVSGYDQCSDGELPAVIAKDSSRITGIEKNNNPDDNRIKGEPPVTEDADMDTSLLSTFGDVTLEDLIASATHTYTDGAHPQGMEVTTTTIDGQTVCNTADLNNWGHHADEDHVCATHYPVIHAEGDLKLTTGYGQGVMIVEGDLEIAGNFEFSGVVIVKGSFWMRGTGLGTGKINGSVIVQGSGDVETESSASGNAQVHYNSCKVEDAFKSALRVRQYSSRAWLFDPAPMPAM